jgi:hypothetical protein
MPRIFSKPMMSKSIPPATRKAQRRRPRAVLRPAKALMVVASDVAVVVAATVARVPRADPKQSQLRLVTLLHSQLTKQTRAMRVTRTGTMKVPMTRKMQPETALLTPRVQRGLMASAVAVVAVVVAVAVAASMKTVTAPPRM